MERSESLKRPRRTARRFVTGLLACAALLAVTAPALADATDYEFARGLMDRGYFRLARIEFQRMVDDPDLDPEQKKEGELGLCLLRAKQALSQAAGHEDGSDPSDVLAEFGGAEAAFEGFLSSNPNHPKRLDATFELCTLLQNKGAFLGRLVEEAKESGSRRLEQYTSDTIRTFDKAIKVYQRVITSLDGTPETDQKRYMQLTQARFYFALAHYYKGRSLPEDHISRIPALERATESFENFVWDHESTVSGYYAYIYKGLAHAELGEHQQALENLRVPLDNLDPNSEDIANEEQRALVMNLLCEAAFRLGRYCNEQKVTSDGFNLQEVAADLLGKLHDDVPQCVENRYGQLAMLEAAKAMLALADAGRALDFARMVSDAAGRSDPSWGRGNKTRADRLIADIIASPAGQSMPQDPAVLWRAAEGKFSQRDYLAAIRAYEAVILASGDEAEDVTRKIEAWEKIGDAYYQTEGDRYYEAIAAMNQIIESYPDHERAGNAAYKRYIYSREQFRVSQDPADQQRFRQAREHFTQNFPRHERAKDLQYFEAYERLERGNTLARQGRADEAREAYRDAEANFKKMDRASAYYELSLARLGQLYFQMAQTDSKYYAQARDVFEKYLATAGDEVTTDPELLSRRGQARAISTYYLARVHADRKEWEKVLATLRGFRREFEAEEAFHANALYQMVRAHLELGSHEAAEEAYAPLRSDPEMRLSQAYLGATFALARKFDELRKAHEEDEALAAEYTQKSADYYHEWMTTRGLEKVPAGYLATVAQMYFDIDELDRSKELAGLALQKLEAEPESEERTRRLAGLRFLFARIAMAGGDAQSAAGALEQLAVKEPLRPDSLQKMAAVLEVHSQDMTKVGEVVGTNPTYLKLLCDAYIRLGLYNRAINLAKYVRRMTREPYAESWYWAKHREALAWYERARQEKDARANKNALVIVEDLQAKKLIASCTFPKLKRELEELLERARRYDLEVR